MSLPASVRVRRAEPADLPAMLEVDGRGFGFQYTEVSRRETLPTIEVERFLVAVEDDEVVAITGSYGFDVTPPGGAPIATEGVTWVSVPATHRRRGILRALFDEQHRGFVAAGLPLAVLTASEGGIYGRFGYGPASVDRSVDVDRRHAGFRPGVPDPGGVRYAGTDAFATAAPGLHARWCALTPGAVSRDAAWWERSLLDSEYLRGGGSAMFRLLHADGFATYRIVDDVCRLVDLCAATPEAHVALWRVLLGIDLVDVVRTRALGADDPLPFLLTDPRHVRQTDDRHGLWARVLDPAAALAARRYAVEVDAVVEVHDDGWGQGGRFRLTGGPDGAECAPTDAEPDAHLDVAALGSVYFGGHRLRTVVGAGRGRVDDPRLLGRLDAALAADRAPMHGTPF